MKQFRMFLFFIICISLAYASFSCKSNPTDPIDPPKNPSEYVWTADTLAINTEIEFQVCMQSIWGTSPTNLYVCGHTASNVGNFFHYDGKKWTPIEQPSNIIGAINPEVVSGTSSNDVWMAGGRLNDYPTTQATSSPFIAHINAIGAWKEYPLPKYKNVWIGNLYIISPNDIWAMGYGTETALFHFDGVNWTLDSLKIPFNPNAHPEIILYSMVKYKNELYLLATKNENFAALRTFYLYKHISDNWTCIDSSAIDLYKYQEPRFGDKLIVTADNNLISYGLWGIYQWDGKDWIHISSTGCWKMARSFGNNLFAATCDGRICLFNGTVLQPVEYFTNPLQVSPQDIWTDGHEAFIVGYIVQGWPMRSIIWHGK